ncbi:MAG: HEAT repeat domain-containing protein [Cyanobacteriota bacterium]|nr:HEAT repeat domain-containing protein [Cyanobacteriota bacterium]
MPEYTAKRLLEKLPNLSDDELKWDYLNDVQFTQPLSAALEFVEDKELALRIVQLAFDIDIKLGAYLAGKVKEEWQEKTVSLIDKLKVPPVLKIILLLKTQSEAAIPRLTQFLENEDSNITNTTIIGLAKFNSDNAINQLILLLEDKTQSSYVRLHVAVALLEKRSKLAVSTLLKLLTSTEYAIRQNAAYILSKCESERKKIITRLKKVLTYRNPDFISTAAFLAGEIQCSEVVPRLIELTDIKEEYEYEDDDEDDDYEYEDEYQQVREDAITALGKIKTEPAIEKLLSIAEDKSRNRDIHCRAIYALRTIKPEAMLPHLIEFLEDGYCDEYYDFFNFLEEIETEAAIPLITKLIESKDGLISAAGVKILGKLKQEKSLSEIIKLAEHKDYNVRESVAEALGNFESEAVNSTLISLLEDKIGDVRKKAAISLLESHPDKAISVLKSLLKDENLYVREETAEAIGQIKLEAAIPELISLLKDKYGNVRYQAVSSLGILEAKVAIPELIPLLKDECEEVIAVSAEALGQLQAESAIPTLVKLLKSNDMFVRKSAFQGLAQIKSEKTMIELNKLFQDKKFMQLDNGSYYSNALNFLGEIQTELGYYQPVSGK